MSNSIAPGSSADVNVKVTALTTNPNVPVTYKTIILKKNLVNGVNTLTQEMMSAANTKYVVKYDYVLGEDITVPANCILEFDGGSVKNGTIIGDDTHIVACKNDVIFTNISILGTWNIPTVYSDWFSDITDPNKLREVENLLSSTRYNKLIIGDKTYVFDLSEEESRGLAIPSNTDVEISGTLTVLPNDTESYYIIYIEEAHNVNISGGVLIGDKTTHTGTTGQWGHGIYIVNSSYNICCRNIDIRDCWGDGIAIGGTSANRNIIIDNVLIDNCRRQGISVIHVKNCKILNSIITNISENLPYAAIDIEPNSDGYTDDVIIDNVYIHSAKGILFANATQEHLPRNITVTNCAIETTEVGIDIKYSKNVLITNNKLVAEDSICLVCYFNEESQNVKISNNYFEKIGDSNTVECICYILGNGVIFENNKIYTATSTPGLYCENCQVIGNLIKCSQVLRPVNIVRNNNFANNHFIGNKLFDYPINGGNSFNNNTLDITTLIFDHSGEIDFYNNVVNCDEVYIYGHCVLGNNRFNVKLLCLRSGYIDFHSNYCNIGYFRCDNNIDRTSPRPKVHNNIINHGLYNDIEYTSENMFLIRLKGCVFEYNYISFNAIDYPEIEGVVKVINAINCLEYNDMNNNVQINVTSDISGFTYIADVTNLLSYNKNISPITGYTECMVDGYGETIKKYGTFAERPTSNINAGHMYLCSSGASIDGGITEALNISIYYTGNGWVDSNGNNVVAKI